MIFLYNSQVTLLPFASSANHLKLNNSEAPTSKGEDECHSGFQANSLLEQRVSRFHFLNKLEKKLVDLSLHIDLEGVLNE